MNIKHNQNGFGMVGLVAVILIVAAVSGTGYYVFNKISDKNKSNSTVVTSSENTKARVTPIASSSPSPSPTAAVIYSSEDLLKAANKEKCADGSPYAKLNRPITSNGWAEVSVGCIGGATAIWHYTDGAWKEVTAFQSNLWCTIIDKYQISSQLYPYCSANVEGFTKWPIHKFTEQEKQEAMKFKIYALEFENGGNPPQLAVNPIP